RRCGLLFGRFFGEEKRVARIGDDERDEAGDAVTHITARDFRRFAHSTVLRQACLFVVRIARAATRRSGRLGPRDWRYGQGAGLWSTVKTNSRPPEDAFAISPQGCDRARARRGFRNGRAGALICVARANQRARPACSQFTGTAGGEAIVESAFRQATSRPFGRSRRPVWAGRNGSFRLRGGAGLYFAAAADGGSLPAGAGEERRLAEGRRRGRDSGALVGGVPQQEPQCADRCLD